ncbi:MAG: hypothetical protein DRI95_00665 [Bacteroidetes bacterium]|nr:MAG: hypothetical protein DRI95_00665 [Bacteroidota bacterium]
MEKKKKNGRPSKLTKELITALEKVVKNAIYLTDKDLVFMLNLELPVNQQIKYQTFKEYKHGISQGENPLIEEFTTLIKTALVKEKINLLEKLKKGENGWQSKAWILERKFSEWNLKTISETDITTKGKPLNSDITITYDAINNE